MSCRVWELGRLFSCEKPAVEFLHVHCNISSEFHEAPPRRYGRLLRFIHKISSAIVCSFTKWSPPRSPGHRPLHLHGVHWSTAFIKPVHRETVRGDGDDLDTFGDPYPGSNRSRRPVVNNPLCSCRSTVKYVCSFVSFLWPSTHKNSRDPYRSVLQNL